MPPSIPSSTEAAVTTATTRPPRKQRTLRRVSQRLAKNNSSHRPQQEHDAAVHETYTQQQTVEDEDGEEESPVVHRTASTAPLLGGDPYSFGGYGAPGGMYNSMMMPGMMMGAGGPFSGVYQVLFGIQNLVFFVSQAVQLVGMHQQSLQQACENLLTMLDSAHRAFVEVRSDTNNSSSAQEEQRRRKLRALRTALLVGGSWLVYKIVRRVTQSSRTRRPPQRIEYPSPLSIPNGYNNSTTGMNPYHGNTMMGSGAYGMGPSNHNIYGGVGGYYGPSSNGFF